MTGGPGKVGTGGWKPARRLFWPMKPLPVIHSHVSAPDFGWGGVGRASSGEELWEEEGQNHTPSSSRYKMSDLRLGLEKHFCLPAVVRFNLERRPRSVAWPDSLKDPSPACVFQRK